jgi:hypothetical protein
MFTVPGFKPFVTTIGKLNFFRWALECKVLDYIETNQETIRTGYNAYLKETTALQKKKKGETQSSTGSNADSMISTASSMTTASSASFTVEQARVTRRRRTKQTPSALRQLQISNTPIQLEFN